jgi:DNA ligase-1
MQIEMMHGNDWTGQDVSGWWLSEKFDGFRARWTGKEFVSRNGNIFNAPAWFKNQMPKMELDGELWAGRGNFNLCSSIIKSKTGDWTKIKFMAFDIPDTIVEDVFRYKFKSNEWFSFANISQVVSTNEAKQYMRDIVENGAEGIMLRAARSPYVPYRTDTLLKMKP